jgi:ubiquinone/menaquinone biosynthesis C-methylase UbiE
MLDAAWRYLVVTGRAFKFEEIDAQSIPYDDETFDVVIANHMLYHVPDRSKAIGEIKRVLKNDGYLIETTVGDNHMKEMMDWLQIVGIEKSLESFANSFTLENGLDQLKQFFAYVTISRYADSLQVTDVEPIMAYMRSSIPASELSEEELEIVRRDLQDELMTKSKISITKDSGLFKAIK